MRKCFYPRRAFGIEEHSSPSNKNRPDAKHVCLSNVPPMTTVEGIAKVFYYQDVNLSCEQIRLDLAAGKVAIIPSSPDEEKMLLQLKEIIIRGNKVSISLESATKQEACLYLPVPMDAKTMVDMWLNCFGVELKEDDVETNENAEAFIKLSTKEFNEITGQTFLLRGEQVKVLKRSSLRVKLQIPSHLNLTEAMLSAAVMQHIEQESIEELYYSKRRNEAFLHLRTTEAKARLLHLRVLSPSSAPSITTVKSPPPEQKEPLARPLNPFTRASLKLVAALPPTMNSEGISALQAVLLASDKKAFITHRNGKVYVEISDHNLYQQLLTKKHVDVLGMKIPISPFEGEVPHWVVTLVPSFPDKPKGQVSTAVIQAFTTVSPGSRVGQIEIGSDSIRVPVSNEQAFVALGRARKLFLFGTEVTVEAGRRLSDKRAIKTETLEAIQIYYLKKKRAEIKATEEQYNVTILLNTPTKPSSPKSPTRSPSYPLDNDGASKLGTINLGDSKTTALVSWRDGNKISYVLRGEAEEAQSIQGYATQLRNELVVDRTECIPPQDFYRLSQDLQKLAKEFDVNLQHCRETGQLAVAGTQDAVVACLASIRELLGATDGFLRLSMPPGKVMFFKEYALPELVRRGQLEGLKVLFPKPDQVCLKGPRDALTDLNPTLQHLINDILETRKEVSGVSGPLVPVLEAFLVQQLRGKVPARVVVFRDKSAEHSTPSIFYKNEEEEEEKIYEEEEEDDDEAEQGLQNIRYATVPKKDFCYRNSQPITYSRFGTARSATVTALVYHPMGSQAHVKQLLESLAVTSSSISFTSREHPAVKRYNTSLCVKRHAVMVNKNLKGRIDLRGFSAESVETVEREIRTFIDKGTVVEEEVTLTKERFQYLNAKRKEEIRSLKSQHNLFFGPKEDKSRELFTMKGFRSNVEQAKRDILRMCEKLRSPRVISFDPKKKVDRNDIKEARRELEDNYDVYINVEESRTKGFTITILGTNDKMIAEVEDEIKKLCAGPMVWKPEDPSTYTQLARLIWKEKKIDLYKFKKEWNLTWLRLDDDNKAVELRSRNPDDATEAVQALQALLANTRVISEPFGFTPPYLHNLLENRQVSTFNRRYMDIQKQCHVAFARQHKLRSGEIFLRGTPDNVKTARRALQDLLQDLRAAVGTKTTQILTIVARNFTKNGWRKAHKFFNETGIYLNFPEHDKNRVIAELTYRALSDRTCTVQVVEGNLLKEQVECIVNAANSKLNHVGGVAKKIADKAGNALREECERLIQQRSQVATGEAVVTTAGDLPSPIKGVIHAVAPIWGNGGEKELLLLQKAVTASLREADGQGWQSVSLPANGSGIYGIPEALCAETIVKAVLTYLTRNTASTLQTIRLCDVKPSVVALWQANLHEEAKNLRQTCKVRTVSQLKAPEELAYQWSWRENDGTFTDFDPDQNYQIEVAYNKQQGRGKVEVTGDLLKQKNGFTYEIDFDAMPEINTKYRANPRPIKRTPKDVASQFVWEVETSAGWEALGPMEQQQLEIAVNRNFTEVLFSWHAVQCKAIFAHNIIDASGTRYRMRRRARNLEQELLDYIEASSGDRAKDDGTQTPRLQAEERVKMVPVELIGLKTELSKGLSKFETLLQKQRSTTQLELPGELTNAHLEELERTAQRFFVTISVCKKLDGSPALQLEGPKSTLQQAKSEITPLVYKAIGSHRVAFPRQWEPQTQTCVLVPIQPTGEEWQQVEKQMKITMPTVSIRSVERVQNKWLWEKYANCKAISVLILKNGGDANECLLFHGTRTAHPSCIYNGQEGFDMRVSGRQGLWGLANYFALNASYSHDYAHTTSDNLKQMFLVKVLVGDNVELQSNRALTKPPQKSTSNSLGFVEDYDSVSGHTNGSKVFMIYTLNHAYPDYLITYTLP
ncbi:Macro domain-containing protein [Balamuthia mandrillaris]